MRGANFSGRNKIENFCECHFLKDIKQDGGLAFSALNFLFGGDK
jgi:hypothetical protein